MLSFWFKFLLNFVHFAHLTFFFHILLETQLWTLTQCESLFYHVPQATFTYKQKENILNENKNKNLVTKINIHPPNLPPIFPQHPQTIIFTYSLRVIKFLTMRRYISGICQVPINPSNSGIY